MPEALPFCKCRSGLRIACGNGDLDTGVGRRSGGRDGE